MNFKILAVALLLAVATASKVALVCQPSLQADANKPFSYVLSASGGSGRYAFDVQGLPAGLRNQGAVIAGIPSASGSYPVTIRTYDDQGNVDVKTVTINVSGGSSANVYVNSGAVSGSSSQTTTSSSSTTATVAVNTNGNGNINVNGNNVRGPAVININGGVSGTNTATAGIPSWFGGFNPTGATPAGGAPTTGGNAPSGSSPTGGVPGGYVPTGAPATPVNIGPVPAGYTPNYPTGPSNPYPSQTFPTGVSPDYIPSQLPTQISNYNYNVVTTRDTYTRTTSDVQSQAIFQRQIDANKAVANLLSIIQQLTANVNGVQGDIPAATQAVNQAIADQRAAQQKVVAAENANKTLTSNIDTVRTQITTLQTNLGKVNGDLAKAQGPIDAATTTKATNQANLDALNARIGNYPNALAAAQQAAQNAQNTLDGLNAKVNGLNNQISSIQVDIDNSGPYSASADADAANLNKQIADLLAQLDRLRAQLAAAQNKSNYYKNVNVTGGAQIKLLNSQIAQLAPQIAAAQAALDAANANINKINSASGADANSVASLKAQLAQDDISINNAQKNKDALAAQSASLVQSITTTSSTLNNLLSQVPAYNNALVQAYNDGNDANDRYNQLKAVLDALKSKYLNSLTQLNDAQAALEKARAQKEIADQGVNEQIQKDGGRSILPYSIPGTGDFGIGTGGANGPNAKGSGANGAPRPGSNIGAGGATGNFASGAGTKPAALTGDLTHYFSNSLTNGVNTATLYPFVIQGNSLQGNGGNRNRNFGCGAASYGDAGTITAVNAGTVSITGNNGAQSTLYLGGCTKLQANKPNYSFSVGDRVQWTGHDAGKQDNKSWNAESVTCYA